MQGVAECYVMLLKINPRNFTENNDDSFIV